MIQHIYNKEALDRINPINLQIIIVWEVYMKIVALFNNKGGVGKSTLGFHLGCALGEIGKKVLLVDLDPQCNLTISAMLEDKLEEIWTNEDDFIEDFGAATKIPGRLDEVIKSPRSIHFLLKPVEDGLNEFEEYPPPIDISENVALIPGRLSLHKYENKIAERWNGVYQGDILSIRTITNIRYICEKYFELYRYDYVIVDTSPSLGILNKTIISTVDGFFIPALPDMFSLYGIRNIGNSLEQWQKEFDTIYRLISDEKRSRFPSKFVQFIGFTIYNARRYDSGGNEYKLANAHFRYANTIPKVISDFIREKNIADVANIMLPIGGMSVMHSHNTFPSVSQALKCPMWKVPEVYREMRRNNRDYLEENMIEVNNGSFGQYEQTKDKYISFSNDFIERVEVL